MAVPWSFPARTWYRKHLPRCKCWADIIQRRGTPGVLGGRESPEDFGLEDEIMALEANAFYRSNKSDTTGYYMLSGVMEPCLEFSLGGGNRNRGMAGFGHLPKVTNQIRDGVR